MTPPESNDLALGDRLGTTGVFTFRWLWTVRDLIGSGVLDAPFATLTLFVPIWFTLLLLD